MWTIPKSKFQINGESSGEIRKLWGRINRLEETLGEADRRHDELHELLHIKMSISLYEGYV